MDEPFVYRLATEAQWKASREAGTIQLTELDERDGFIHLSTAGQLILTANLHFSDETRLWVLLFDRKELNPALKWEHVPSRWDRLPHYYGALYLRQVQKSYLMNRNPGGSFGISTEGAI